MVENEVIEKKRSGEGSCYVKQRYVLCFLSFLGVCTVNIIRNHIGVTTLAMLNTTHLNASQSVDEETTGYNQSQHEPASTQTNSISLTTIQQGHLLGAYFYGYTAGNFPAGILVNKLGFRKVLSISLFLSGVFEVLIPLVVYQSFYLALIFRALIGLFQSPCVPAIMAIWAKWSPPFEKSKLNSITLSGSVFGGIIVLPMAGVIVKYLGWEAVFYVTGSIGMAWSVLFFYFTSETPESNPRISEEEKVFLRKSIGSLQANSKKIPIPWKSIFTSISVYAFVMSQICDVWYQLSIPALFPSYLVMALKYNILESSIVLMLPFLLQFFVGLFIGYITDLLRAKNIFTTTTIRKINSCTALYAAGTLTIISSYLNNEALVIAVFTMGSAISGLRYAGFLANPLDIAPRFASVIFGLGNSLACSTGVLGPLAAAYMVKDKTDRAQWQNFFWLTFGISCFGATFFAIFGSGVQEKWAMRTNSSELDCSTCNDKETKERKDDMLLTSISQPQEEDGLKSE